ncbi:MAG: imidazole glycerol-phosphate synthase subunit HisH [Abditibacteriota bacterium]|nr:imidazole glycerol-phosphate synthase subunit HisH [Abditibacteriota bacterium]
MITIVDCGINNLRSVQKAFEHLGHQTQVTRDAKDIGSAERIVLPGVGAFGTAMKSLQNAGVAEPLIEAVAGGKPFLGICLAQQLVFDWSEELGVHAGLGLVAGKVLRLPDEPGLKIPHIGWSALSFPRETRLFRGIEPGAMVYFVHSYHAVPDDEDVVAATSQHGPSFVAAIERDNLMAVQFHPEKSSAVGLQILQNFATL